MSAAEAIQKPDEPRVLSSRRAHAADRSEKSYGCADFSAYSFKQRLSICAARSWK